MPTRAKAALSLHHVERLIAAPDVLAYAKRINSLFVRQKKTDLPEVDSNYEAVYLRDVATDKIASIVVCYRADGESTKPYYWIPIVWVSDAYRGRGCFKRMIDWLKVHARSRGAKSLETEVKHWNKRMVDITDANWKRTYVRYHLPIGRP